MKPQRAGYQVAPYPKYRQWMAAAFRLTSDKPMIHGLLDVNVTGARAFLREHKARTGESLSFTAFLIACLAQAVDEHKDVQAFRQGGRRLILFDDVDVLIDVERDVAGQRFVIPTIIRAANRKTFRQIHDEIRATQRADTRQALKRVGPLSLPAPLFRPFLWAFDVIGSRRPRLWKRIVGTVEISSVGMFGNGAGWGIPPTMSTALVVTVGGIGERQAVVDGRVTVQDYLSLTISVNHELVDGAPAARFAQRFKALIECGYGLSDVTATVAPEQRGEALRYATRAAQP